MRALSILVVVLLAACGGDEQPLAADGSEIPTSEMTERPVPDLPDGAVPLSVTLWHCGVLPVTVDGRTWEVPKTETVDGDPALPLDATNTPSDWIGRGSAVVRHDVMTYTDEGGEIVGFVPDDGQPPGPCA